MVSSPLLIPSHSETRADSQPPNKIKESYTKAITTVEGKTLQNRLNNYIRLEGHLTYQINELASEFKSQLTEKIRNLPGKSPIERINAYIFLDENLSNIKHLLPQSIL